MARAIGSVGAARGFRIGSFDCNVPLVDRGNWTCTLCWVPAGGGRAKLRMRKWFTVTWGSRTWLTSTVLLKRAALRISQRPVAEIGGMVAPDGAKVARPDVQLFARDTCNCTHGAYGPRAVDGWCLRSQMLVVVGVQTRTAAPTNCKWRRCGYDVR